MKHCQSILNEGWWLLEFLDSLAINSENIVEKLND